MTDKHVTRWTADYNDQIKVRLEKRKNMLEFEQNPYKNGLKANISTKLLRSKFDDMSKEEIEALQSVDKGPFQLAGRAMLIRNFGKASFVQMDDGTDKFQLYVQKGGISEEEFQEFKLLDYGDIIHCEGEVFKTNKGELSLKVTKFSLLTKSLRPLPEKFHGLSDPELCYRMRYVDMIMNPDVREVMRKRSAIIRYIRDYFHKRGHLEVETPMLHPVAGGATAKPFVTHHNSLSMDMFLRIAPELHLKRLIVGGFDRVFEMNRCFRNEGLSIKHNPEFTSIEFYEAYSTYEDLMEVTEELIVGLVDEVVGAKEIHYEGNSISFARPFKKMSMTEAVLEYTHLEKIEDLDDKEKLKGLLKKKGFELDDLKDLSRDKLLVMCFEEFAEAQLISPTFITEYPTEISPLSRRNDARPEIVDRFEFFINGWEIANAFSELNDPQDQLHRFAEQAAQKEKGDEEACDVDYDYVRALEYGMPPTAGEGIGIDRLCMILTKSSSIRDVILFPQLKAENFFGGNNEHSQQLNDSPKSEK